MTSTILTTGVPKGTNNEVVYPVFDLTTFRATYGDLSGSITVTPDPINFPAHSITHQFNITSGIFSGSTKMMQPFNAPPVVTENGVQFEFFVQQMQAILSFASTTLTVGFDHVNGRYAFSSSLANAQITGSLALGRMLGWPQSNASQVQLFISGTSGATLQTTGSFIPWFSWISTQEGKSNPYSDTYEPGAISTERYCDDGSRKYSVQRAGSPQFEDWSYTLEPPPNLWNYHTASTLSPQTSGIYTWEQFIKEQRSIGCWTVASTSISGNVLGDYNTIGYRDATYQMRTDAAFFKPKKTMMGYNGAWDIDCLTNVVSRPGIPFVFPSAQAITQYDEGLISFPTASSVTDFSFNFTFSGSPIVVLTKETGSLGAINIFGNGITATGATCRTSAPFSGSVRYRAIYSTTYPCIVSSAYSSSFTASAGTTPLTIASTTFTASWLPWGTVPTQLRMSPFRSTDLNADVAIAPTGTMTAAETPAFSSVAWNGTANYIAVKV